MIITFGLDWPYEPAQVAPIALLAIVLHTVKYLGFQSLAKYFNKSENKRFWTARRRKQMVPTKKHTKLYKHSEWRFLLIDSCPTPGRTMRGRMLEPIASCACGHVRRSSHCSSHCWSHIRSDCTVVITQGECSDGWPSGIPRFRKALNKFTGELSLENSYNLCLVVSAKWFCLAISAITSPMHLSCNLFKRAIALLRLISALWRSHCLEWLLWLFEMALALYHCVCTFTNSL